MNIYSFRHSMYHTSISPQTVYSTQNYTNQRKHQRKTILCKNSTQRQKLSNKRRSQRHCHITLSKNEKPNTKLRHCCCATSQVFLCFCMCTVILITYAQKQCRTSNSVSLHCKNGPNNTYFIHCELSQYNHTHMGYTTICNNFFLIYLTQCCLTCINNTYQTYCTYERVKIRTSIRKEIDIKTQLSICSLFLLYSCLLDRSSCASFYVSFWQPQMKWHQRHFYSKRLKEPPPLNILTAFRQSKMSQQFVVCCTCSAVLKLQQRLHCLTSKQSIKHLLVGSLYFTCTAPSLSNKLKHWLLCTLIQYIKSNQINSCKASKQKSCQTKKLCIKCTTMSIHCSPTTLNSLWHLKCSLQDHPKTQSVLTKFQRYSKKTTPALIKRYNAAEWTSTPRTGKAGRKYWTKSRPQSHCLEQSSQTKLESNIAMCFTVFTRQNGQAKTSNCWCLLNHRKLSFQWNRQKQSSTLNTKTKNHKPHCAADRFELSS